MGESNESNQRYIGKNIGKHIKWKKNKIWFDENCKKALEIRDKARLEVIQNPSNENKRTLASKQREAKKTIRMAKRLWEKQRVCRLPLGPHHRWFAHLVY